MRASNNQHWGGNASTLHFDEDGGFYMESWRDFMAIVGHSGVNYLRGPLFSNVLKSGLMTRGKFDLSSFSHEELRRRLLLGPAVPSIATINGRPDPENQIAHGGMSKPLERGVQELGRATAARMSTLTGKQLQSLTGEQLMARLSGVKRARFDHESIANAMHGEHQSRLHLPKEP